MSSYFRGLLCGSFRYTLNHFCKFVTYIFKEVLFKFFLLVFFLILIILYFYFFSRGFSLI